MEINLFFQSLNARQGIVEMYVISMYAFQYKRHLPSVTVSIAEET